MRMYQRTFWWCFGKTSKTVALANVYLDASWSSSWVGLDERLSGLCFISQIREMVVPFTWILGKAFVVKFNKLILVSNNKFPFCFRDLQQQAAKGSGAAPPSIPSHHQGNKAFYMNFLYMHMVCEVLILVPILSNFTNIIIRTGIGIRIWSLVRWVLTSIWHYSPVKDNNLGLVSKLVECTGKTGKIFFIILVPNPGLLQFFIFSLLPCYLNVCRKREWRVKKVEAYIYISLWMWYQIK